MQTRAFILKTAFSLSNPILLQTRSSLFQRAVKGCFERAGYENVSVLYTNLAKALPEFDAIAALPKADSNIATYNSSSQWIENNLSDPDLSYAELAIEASRGDTITAISQLQRNCNEINAVTREGLLESSILHMKYFESGNSAVVILGVGQEKPNVSMLPQIV